MKNCKHYNNKLQIFAQCCYKYYDCTECHNELNDHKLYRSSIKKIKCIDCNFENKISNKCENCNIQFAKTYCNICNIWCNKINDMHHCNYCGVCKYGKKEDMFHCFECNICFLNCIKDKHVCNIDNCSICLENLYSSNEVLSLLKCNHIFHKKCLHELIKNTDKSKKIPSCSICKRSAVLYQNYESIFDKNIEKYPMLEYYKNYKANILCNDCNNNSITKYHKTYNKCLHCKSYNTSIIKIFKS